MIVKMKFLRITGPADQIDRVVDQYISKYEIHWENALSELKTVRDLRPFMDTNPYKEPLSKVTDYMSYLKEGSDKVPIPLSAKEAATQLRQLEEALAPLFAKKDSLEQEYDKTKDTRLKFRPYKGLEFNVSDILHLTYIKYRFGRIQREYYEKFEKYVNSTLDTIFYPSSSSKEYVWGVYFVPATQADRIDAIYASLHFERYFIPDGLSGTPDGICQKLVNKEGYLEKELDKISHQIETFIQEKEDIVRALHITYLKLSNIFDVRKMAACTKEGHDLYFILCGWMPEKSANAFQRDILKEPDIYCIVEDDPSHIFSGPPTKLHNPRLFKPFEMLIRMYGLPAYDELDPTIFVAITYSFIFGWMFGDVGQGLVLVALGLFLFLKKKLNLGAIMASAGVFSTFFGFMFGSVFGFEDVLDAVWLRPLTDTSTLPVIGKLNSVLVYSIVFGIFLIITTIIFNIYNGIRSKSWESAFLGPNGIAGLFFYGTLIICLFLIITGHAVPGGILLGFLLGLPVIAIAFREPISNWIEKKKGENHTGPVMFFVQTFFEMFEVLLSYFSNTLSFVRIGAFAISHAAMMEVVMMLAGAENGSPSLIVVVLGNLFVCLLEGLIVAIQVLRLEYYEFFSRFYKGTGRAFHPFSNTAEHK